MSQSTANHIRYMAEINNVREVAVWGTVDLPFWRAMLHQEALLPYSSEGKAEVAICATALRWKGFKFREVIVIVAICADEAEAQRDGFYLAHAFNSSRSLAFAERFFFKTPYYHGDIRVEETTPLIELSDTNRSLFKAQMSAPRAPSSIHYEAWKGPVFLPTKVTKRNRPGHKFFVDLSGEQATYAFSPDIDYLEIIPSEKHLIFQWLSDSNFTAREWRIRDNAAHAKSKTYTRDFTLAGL